MLKIYNTLGRKKQVFKPIKGKKILMYHCGPTVYWTQHIGNMRGVVCADLIVRALEYLGYKVILVRNYTDVGHLSSDADEGEDKMEKSAKREGLPPQKIAKKYIKIFESDIRELNVRPPKFKPRATETIPEIIEMVKILLQKGFAYSTPLAVYFYTSKAKNYYELSGQKPEKNIIGGGKADVADSNKKNPADFALWFFKAGVHKNVLQFWRSPFSSPLVKNGEGFPGWHIECSAMVKKFLGKTIDIHMGGIEHISVHHTNEIAQSEAVNGVKFVNYWLHNEHLLFENEKMAKSSGTGFALSEIKKNGFNPLSLRYLFLTAHYRSRQNFTWPALQAAEQALKKLSERIIKLQCFEAEPPAEAQPRQIEKCRQTFLRHLNNDFQMPQALALAWEMLDNKEFSNKQKLRLLLDFDRVFGLGLDKIKPAKKKEIVIPQEIGRLVEKREKCRQEKNWQKADELRKKIESLGWLVEDTPTGPQMYDVQSQVPR